MNNEKLNQEGKAIADDYLTKQVDPEHYWSSLSTPAKISTNIGLILGGIGAGLTRGENLAYKMLQANIDRDMAAQKAEMGKKENLLQFNMKQHVTFASTEICKDS